MKTLGTGNVTEVVANSDFIQQAALVAATGQAFDVPTGGGQVAFSATIGVDLWVRFGSTAAAIPTTSTTGGSTTNNTILNPTIRNITSTLACTGYSVISATTGIAVMEWWNR